ncbi:MAG TPA: 2,3-bisphosphoglycerate-independent phosphoglycerate mutase [Anaerolineales bacterium]|nr:2,3-bisphosphoglycerate-independent phosphoglycerate mutase [Anaerolineales bacterium]
MADFRLMRELHKPMASKIVLLIMDGLGGLPLDAGGATELESARTPNLDRLAAEGALGQIVPVRPGIAPGSGPAHLALFGYDPLEHEVGRGVLEAIGIGMAVRKGDVAARGNFCTVDQQGKISDRRAGRIPTEEAAPLVGRLASIRIPDVDVEVGHVKDYRFAVVMRGEGLDPALADTDPQQTDVPPLPVRPMKDSAQDTAERFNAWIALAQTMVRDHPRANALTLRGFSSDPALPQFPEIYGLRSACVAAYPMYRGVAELVGMEVLSFTGDAAADEFAATAQSWESFDFFFLHIKHTDSKGEDGDFDGKVAVIEGVDAVLPRLLELHPSVLAVTGDHSTPARMRTHTWHPVPFLLWAPKTIRPDRETSFGERACAHGGLGTFPASDAMPLLMAHAERLTKFGA